MHFCRARQPSKYNLKTQFPCTKNGLEEMLKQATSISHPGLNLYHTMIRSKKEFNDFMFYSPNPLQHIQPRK